MINPPLLDNKSCIYPSLGIFNITLPKILLFGTKAVSATLLLSPFVLYV